MTADARPSFLDQQRDAALQQIREQQAEFTRIANIVIPERRDALRHSARRVSDLVKLGDNDFLVEVTDRHKGAVQVAWTTVIGGKSCIYYFHTQDEALLHLVARRHDPDSDGAAAFYAGRVLGLPAADA